MSGVLALLAWSPLLLALYLAPQSLLYRAERGISFAASARDDEPPSQSPYLQRAEKALRNFLETYGAFIALAVAAELGHRTSPTIFWGGVLYIVGRIAYLPLYLLGIFMVRSLVWCLIAIGLAMMFFGVVL